jgi:hypothetical protein
MGELILKISTSNRYKTFRFRHAGRRSVEIIKEDDWCILEGSSFRFILNPLITKFNRKGSRRLIDLKYDINPEETTLIKGLTYFKVITHATFKARERTIKRTGEETTFYSKHWWVHIT